MSGNALARARALKMKQRIELFLIFIFVSRLSLQLSFGMFNLLRYFLVEILPSHGSG